MQQETWYILEDGSNANPADVVADKDGVLRHKNGTAVAMRSPGVPRSRGVDGDAERKRAAAIAKSAAENQPTDAKDMTAEAPKAGYKTREQKPR